MALREAIRVATSVPTGEAAGALYGPLRERVPGLPAVELPKHRLVRLSHAIEDEIAARAEGGLLAGAFQRPELYAQSRRRWRDLAEGAAFAFVLAGFERQCLGRAPVELPLPERSPLRREWILAWDAPGAAACLVARERPGGASRDARRLFDVVWTVDPDVCRHVSRALVAVAAVIDPRTGAAAEEVVDAVSPPTARAQLGLAAAISARALASGA